MNEIARQVFELRLLHVPFQQSITEFNVPGLELAPKTIDEIISSAWLGRVMVCLNEGFGGLVDAISVHGDIVAIIKIDQPE